MTNTIDTNGRITERNKRIQSIIEAIENSENIVIVSHLRPDGDALGSQLALGLCLNNLGKNIIFINETGVPDNLKFLPHSSLIKKPESTQIEHTPDLVIALDTATIGRVGEQTLSLFSNKINTKIINIDHHISNPLYGNINLIDSKASSTGEIIYDIIESSNWDFSNDILSCIYIAITSDTGSFRYASTTPRSLEIAKHILEYGVDTSSLSHQLYNNKPVRKIFLLKELLNNFKISANGKVASWILTLKVKKNLALKPEDTEGLIDIPKSIEGVVVAVFFDECENNIVRLSSRSNDESLVDVNHICSLFGGGGHQLAAGASIKGNINDVEKKFLNEIENELSR